MLFHITGTTFLADLPPMALLRHLLSPCLHPQSHFDDAARFRRPIYSLRLFSDSRLSFGGHLFGSTNNDFFVPMPRG
jgi:hypothetical protein